MKQVPVFGSLGCGGIVSVLSFSKPASFFLTFGQKFKEETSSTEGLRKR